MTTRKPFLTFNLPGLRPFRKDPAIPIQIELKWSRKLLRRIRHIRNTLR